MSKSSKPARPTRRNFLKVAAATASAVAAPNVVSAQGVINMRWQRHGRRRLPNYLYGG